MRKLKSIALMLSIMAVLTALPASFLLAHHSTTHFSKEFTEMEGTLVELRWRYPHIYFVLEVTEGNGEKVTWQMEAGTVYMLGRAGVTRDMFEIGDELRVAGNRSTLFEDKFWLTNVLLPAGRLSEERAEVLVVARGHPRWADELVGGRDKWSDTAFRDSSGIEKGKGFFRVWSPPGANSVTAIADPNALPLAEIATAAAKAIKETWDPYAFDAACELPGLPKVMHGPHPHQFIDGGDQILFVSGGYNVTRTLHLQSVENPIEQPLSPLGYSIANWKNEHTLLVETTRINYPYLDLGGYGQSEVVVIKERYTLSEDQSRMDYKVTITDPVMLTAPFIKTGVWVDLNEGMVKYDCVVTSASQ